jgi:hypothetical protein
MNIFQKLKDTGNVIYFKTTSGGLLDRIRSVLLLYKNVHFFTKITRGTIVNSKKKIEIFFY